MNQSLNQRQTREIIYFKRDAGRSFDRKDFLSWFYKRVNKTTSYFDMFEYNSRILVAIDGNVKSVVLLHVLNRIERNFPKARIYLAYINEGIHNYSMERLRLVENIADDFGLELYVSDFETLFGVTIDHIANKCRNPCEICRALKEWALNDLAYKKNCDRIALGRTQEDLAYEILMCLYNNNLEKLLLHPFTPRKIHEKLIPIVTPLMLLKSKEVVLYAHLQRLPFSRITCPYYFKSPKRRILKQLYYLEEKYPGLLYGLINFTQVLFTNMKMQLKLEQCKVCGYPSITSLCDAHKLLMKLKLA